MGSGPKISGNMAQSVRIVPKGPSEQELPVPRNSC